MHENYLNHFTIVKVYEVCLSDCKDNWYKSKAEELESD